MKTDLFDPNTDKNGLAYSSDVSSKSGSNACITILPGVYIQLESMELEFIPKRIRNLLQSIYELSKEIEGKWNLSNQSKKSEHPSIVIFREDLAKKFELICDQAVKPAAFSNLLGRLKNAGILETPDSTHTKKVSRNLIIRSFSNLPQLKNSSGDKVRSKTQLSDHAEISLSVAREINGEDLSGLSDKIEFTIQDVYLHGLFDPVMVLDNTLGVAKKTKTVTRHGFPLKIQSVAYADEALMEAADQALTRDVFARCSMQNAKRVNAKLRSMSEESTPDSNDELRRMLSTQIPNMFTLSEVELATMMGVDPQNKANRENAIAAFRRIANTQFQVDSSNNPIFSEALSWIRLNTDVESNIFKMRFWQILQETKPRGGVRVFVFSIDHHAFQAMLLRPDTPTQYKAHKSLSNEKQGIAHIIYNWVRKHGIKKQEALFDQEYSISTLYKALEIKVDHPDWDRLPLDQKELLIQADKRSISKQLTTMLRKYEVDSWESDGSTIKRSIFHGIESWEIKYNQRKRRFKFRVNPQDSLIGYVVLEGKKGQLPTKSKETFGSWDLPTSVIDRHAIDLAEYGHTLESVENLIGEWQVKNESKVWNSALELENDFSDSMSQIQTRDVDTPYQDMLIEDVSLLEDWAPTLELKNALYKEADTLGISPLQSKFLLKGKADEFKSRYSHKEYNSESEIESAFYRYFLKALSFEQLEKDKVTYFPSSKDDPMENSILDRAWADSGSVFSAPRKQSTGNLIEGTSEREE